jgi:hypothetical protein
MLQSLKPPSTKGQYPFLKTSLLSDAERATLMSGACAKAYGWSPKDSTSQSRSPSL